MHAERIGEAKGKVTGTRVVDGGAVESSVQERGTLLGVAVTHLVTFTTAPTPAGTLVAVGRGVFRTDDGEVATWEARGVLTPKGPGMAASVRAAALAQAAPHGKLARLAQAPLLFEVEVGAEGDLRMACFAWT